MPSTTSSEPDVRGREPDDPAEAFAPEEYPWVGPAVRSALLLSDGVVDLDPVGGVSAPTDELAEPLVDVSVIEQALAAEGAPPLAERTLVVAVGSNQTPRTIARKLRRSGRGVPMATPFVRCTVHHLAVGHVANTSARGYVPAAPYRAEGEQMELVATWFDDAQLAVIDETEPNYDRVRLTAQQHPLTLATGAEPAHFDVYASRRGILAHGQPIPLRHRQQELFNELVALTGTELLIGDAAEVCARLAAHPAALAELARVHGLVAQDGLHRAVAAAA